MKITIRLARGLIPLVAALALAPLVAAASPAHATLSEMLTKMLEEAQSAESQRQYSRAIELYERAYGDQWPQADKQRGLLRMRADEYERYAQFGKAEADLTAALAVQPVDPKLYADRGYFYMRRQRWGDALYDFVTGTRLDPANATFPFGAGRVLAALSDYDGAIDRYNEAIALDPRDATRYLARAEAHVRLNRLAEARADYVSAVDIGRMRPSDAFFAHLGLGYTQIALGDHAAAVRNLDLALDFDRHHARALIWRGWALEKLGRRNDAIADYERAHRAEPGERWIMARLRKLRSE